MESPTTQDFSLWKEEQCRAKSEFFETRNAFGLNSLKDDDCVLLVGEGNFSFSALLIQHTSTHIVATTLFSSSHLLSESTKRNIAVIKKFGGRVHTDVDATCLKCHHEINRNVYKAVIFNFPHVPGKMKIGANRDLLRKFFMSAKDVIASDGEVHVTLCKGQGGTMADICHRKWENTWQITSMAASSDFVLDHVEPFNVEDYPGYTCSGYRGCEKSFLADGALTHVFKLGHSILMTLGTVLTTKELKVTDGHQPLVSTHIEICQNYKSLFETSEHPIAKTLSFLINHIRKCSSSNLQVISLPDVLVCPGKSCLKHHMKCASAIERLPCAVSSLLSSTSCMSQVLEKQLNTEADIVIMSSYICCPYNIAAFELPLSCSLIFLGRSMDKIVNEVHEVLNEFLCKKNSAVITSSKNFCVSNLLEDSFCHPSNLESLPKCKELQHSSNEKSIRFEEIGTVFLVFSVIQSKSHALRKDVHVVISHKNLKNEAQKEIMELGNVYIVSLNQTILFCTCIAIEYVSMAKFHIFKHQLLLSDKAYFDAIVYDDEESCMIYRSPSLYPAFYIHDVSFWLPEEFHETELILLVKNLVGDLICDIRLIDSYSERYSQKKSHCYSFMYQSCDKPLSKEKTHYIHTNIIRPSIEKHFNVKLR